MAASNAASKAVKFERDEEFDDFQSDEWKVVKVAKANLWVEDWDVDDTSDQVSQEVRAAIEKAKAAGRQN